MENTQGVWILYSILLTLNCFGCWWVAAAERHGIVTGTPELDQPRYFRYVLTLTWIQKINCTAEEIMLVFSQEAKGVDSFKVNRDQVWWGRPPKNICYKRDVINQEKLQDRLCLYGSLRMKMFWDWTTMLQLVFSGLDHYLYFLRVPWRCFHPHTTV